MQTQRQLPYIEIKSPPLKLLIDTGANQSFISPNAVQTYFNNMPLNFTPFEVSNIHAVTRSDSSITIPAFPEFKDETNLTFFVYNFHDYFDGLIGSDLLDKWEAVIDYKNKTISTQTTTVPIKVYDSRNANLYEEIIPAGCTRLVRVPVNAKDGEVYVPEQVVSNCQINECLTTVKNSRGILQVHNPSRSDVIFSMDCAIKAEINNFESTCSEPDPERIKNVISRLRTDHLNEEERINLETLCMQTYFILKANLLLSRTKLSIQLKPWTRPRSIRKVTGILTYTDRKSKTK